MDEENDDELDEETPSPEEAEQAEAEQEEEEAQEEADEVAEQNWQNLQTVKGKKALWTKKKIWQTVISAITPLIPYILVVALVIVGGMALGEALDSVISKISGWFSSSDSGEENSVASPFGVTGEDFYGIRTVYRDEEQSTVDIIEDYVAMVDTVITTIESDSSLNATIDVTIELPDMSSYDFSILLEAEAEAEFALNYSTLYELLTEMAKTVYDYDNPDSTAEFATSYNLVDYASGVNYFGYNSTLLTDLDSLVLSYVKSYYTYEKRDSGGDEVSASEVEDLITQTVSTVVSSKTATRSEKLYIKDYILSSNEDDTNYRIYGISAEEYVAYIFMPKTNVTFNSFSFIIANIDLDNIAVYIQTADGTTYAVTCDDDGGLVSTDDETGISSYLFESASDLNISAGVYEYIDTADLAYLSGGKNLYEIACEKGADSIYLSATNADGSTPVDGTGEAILTWQQTGVMALTDYDGSFGIIEQETDYD